MNFLEKVVLEPGCFLGLATSAIEAYNRETNGFILGLRQPGGRRATLLRASYPLQTEDRKPNSVAHGNLLAFDRARSAMRRIHVGLDHLGGFHSHTGTDGAPSLSDSDLEYVEQEMGWIHAARPRPWEDRWLEILVAIRKRDYARAHKLGWSWRRYARKIGCTVALSPNVGYDLTFSGFWVPARSNGGPGKAHVGRPSEVRLSLPWRRNLRLY